MTAQLALMPAQPAPTNVVTLSDIQQAIPAAYHTCYVIERPVTCAAPDTDIYRDWDTSVAAGKSYLVGESMNMQAYLRAYTSQLQGWMKLAYRWARQNPGKTLFADSSPRRDWYGFSQGGYVWHIGERGDHVEFILPHQDCGGEKCWMSRDGKTRLLVNED